MIHLFIIIIGGLLGTFGLALSAALNIHEFWGLPLWLQITCLWMFIGTTVSTVTNS